MGKKKKKEKCNKCAKRSRNVDRVVLEKEKSLFLIFFFKFPALIPLAVFAAFIFYEIPLFVHVMNSQWRIILFE